MKHEGLYDSANDHDSCGVGFIARLDAAPRHDVITDALQALRNLEHRGALGGDTTTGDGAGLLLQIPDRFYRETAVPSGAFLPPLGEYAAGMVFLPTEKSAAEECERILDAAAQHAGMLPLGWRDVPTDDRSLGELARATCPRIRQVFIARGAVPAAEFERKLFVIRRIAEKRIAALDHFADFHIATLSSRTIAYKGMLTATQLSEFYPDLHDPRMTSAFALIHQRYSTNTFPMWRLPSPCAPSRITAKSALCAATSIACADARFKWPAVSSARMSKK